MSNAKKPGTGASNRRRKELAAAKLERQTARRAARERVHRRRVVVGWSLAVLVGAVAVLAVMLWPDSGTDTVAQPDASGSASPSASPTSPSPSPIEGCDPAPVPADEHDSWDSAPALGLDDDTDYQLVLTTNCGEVVIDTEPTAAPETVTSMLWLADAGFFDETLCHRLTTGNLRVLQCGDPTATGTGGPGYAVPDENLPEDVADNYPAGTVAMANAGPGTSGSQFFIVYQDSTLPPDYTIWGTVTSGLDIVERIAEAGVSGGGTDGPPAAPIGIVRARPEPALG